MSSEACLALLLDGPLQSWGHSSRFDRRTTALHPTRSGVLGLVAAALGIDKFATDERRQLEALSGLQVTVAGLPRRARGVAPLRMHRLVDYHTVTGIRRASGKVDKDATVQTYRHYLMDARFGVLLEGEMALLKRIAEALQNPVWGVWLGRKSCLPASPVLAGVPSQRAKVWSQLLKLAGYSGSEPIESFDHIIEAGVDEPGAELIEDTPVGFGNPIGQRHAPRWIKRVLASVKATDQKDN